MTQNYEIPQPMGVILHFACYAKLNEANEQIAALFVWLTRGKNELTLRFSCSKKCSGYR